ncbi:MAG TPA: hypothetical protein PKL84_03460 [Candidatus Hydrogenedentes bacterium]|nr:hypothetical protein [Candidatus Hydrogenedentota bacterium]
MRRTRYLVAIAVAALCSAAVARGDVAELVSALSGDSAEARHHAFEHADKYGPEAIIAVAALLDSDRPGVVYAARNALEMIAGAATAREDTRKAASNALTVAALATKNRDPLLRLLAYVGDAEAIPALANLLVKAPESFDAALHAIENIGVHARRANDTDTTGVVCETLLTHLARSEGRARTAVINALGAVGHPRAVDSLIDELRARGPSADAAAQALGYIGDLKAWDPLWEAFERHGSGVALEACLRIAENQPDARAVKLYTRMLDQSTPKAGARRDAAPGDPRVLCAALRGIGKTATSNKALKTLLPYLDAERADVYGAAFEAIAGLPGDNVTRALLKETRGASPARKAALQEILEIRGASASTTPPETGIEE